MKRLVGLVGEGISASRTPAMHAAEGRALGLDYTYRLIDTAEMATVDLGAILADARAAGFAGLNITHPFKQRVLGQVTESSDEVTWIGAANTILFTADGIRAHNTDHSGFLRAFQDEMRGETTRSVLLLGSGGAGRAVGFALAAAGVEQLYISDLAAEAAATLAGDIARRFPRLDVESAAADQLPTLHLDGLVNATPMGMAGHPGLPVDPALLVSRPWVVDIVYFPLETALLKRARVGGCKTMSGRGMAVMQAVDAFELFTGHAADPARMFAVFDSFEG